MKKRTYPKLYFTWRSMRTRCNNPSFKSYANYGGRGVKVCDRWQKSFKAFVEDMGPKPDPTYQLDRIDNDGDYTPENCRWVSRSKNLSNTRRNNLVTYQGETKTITQWASIIGISPNTFKWRVKNWTLKKTMETPRTENNVRNKL